MELIIYSPKNDEFINAVEFNYSDLKNELTASLAKYEGLVYTDDTINEAKTDRAKLNKLSKAINDKKIEVKKQCLKPYEDFENKIKELLSMIDTQAFAIDGQVKNYERQQKDKKKAEILAYYEETIGDMKDILPFENIFNERWLNTTASIKKIKEEIDEICVKVIKDLQVIFALKSEFDLQIKDKYLQTLDLSAALAEKARLEEQKKKVEEYEAAKEKRPHIIGPDHEDFKDLKPGDRFQFAPGAEAPEIPTQVDFRVWATMTQLIELKQFLKDKNIRYGRVE